MSYDLVCYGEFLWDIFDDEKRLGGAPFNSAAIATLLGMESAVITAVGDDDLGDELLLTAAGKTDIICQKNGYPTGTVQVTLDEHKRPAFDLKEDVAYDHIEFTPDIKDACSHARFFAFGTLGQRGKVSRDTLMKAITRVPGTKIFDLNHRPTVDDWEDIFHDCIKKADILKLNEDELNLLNKLYRTEDCIPLLFRDNKLKYIFVTRGPEGASLFTKDNRIDAPAPDVEVLDTTGCGDAFLAAIAYSILNKYEDKKMLEFALDISTRVAMVKGAVPDSI